MQTLAHRYLEHETRALLTRLDRIRPFALTGTMVPAANLARPAQRAIDHHLAQGRVRLRQQVVAMIRSLRHGRLAQASVDEAQRQFALLRLQFNGALDQFDLFADVLAQRSDRDHGVWLAGLDALAADALALPQFYPAPPVVCHVDRGIGAAIRRARTRLPGGGTNPVAIVRIPRERLVGAGIASSMVHEVGHQAAALLGLVESLRSELQAFGDTGVWPLWRRWISEIVADFWSVLRLGQAATLGLMGVLGLPRPFVYRVSPADPHPAPWIRVLLSAAIGAALYPGRGWARMAATWQRMYPLQAAGAAQQPLLAALEGGIEPFVSLLLAHPAPGLQGMALAGLADAARLSEHALQQTLEAWRQTPRRMYLASPCHACAAIGQARAAGTLAPETESQWMADLLTAWALRRSPEAGHRRQLIN